MTTSQVDTDPEEDIEGLGEDEEESPWGDYPIDTLLIRNETRTIYDILRRMEKGSFLMNPDFQRDFIWPVDKQSKLIESVLMRIPLPVFYLAEDGQGRMVVVDGLQRLSTFQRFAHGKLKLNLPDNLALHGKRFQDLQPKLQNRVEDCNLVLYVIDAKVPERARLDIFERVNGGVPLTRQQMRNCLFMGQATRFLRKQSETSIFLEATGGSLRSSTMRDREFVNRFCAFHLLGPDEYRGDMDDFLARCLTTMNEPTADLEELAVLFQTSLGNNFRVFGEHSFRKHTPLQDRRSVLNASLWDVMSTGLTHYPGDVVDAKASNLRNEFYRLMSNDDFVSAITYSPNDAKRVTLRFVKATTMFEEVLGARSN